MTYSSATHVDFGAVGDNLCLFLCAVECQTFEYSALGKWSFINGSRRNFGVHVSLRALKPPLEVKPWARPKPSDCHRPCTLEAMATEKLSAEASLFFALSSRLRNYTCTSTSREVSYKYWSKAWHMGRLGICAFAAVTLP